jgi:hypothetical protein
MFPTSITKTLAAASANNISVSQSLGAAGNLTITGTAAAGGVATLDTQRRVIITSAGNDSGLTWTVTGTDETNNVVVDSFAGATAGNAVQSNRDFLTVTKIAGSAATAGNVTAGTNGVGSCPWHSISTMKTPDNVSVAVTVSGAAVNYTVEYTYDNYWTPGAGNTPPALPTVFPVQTLVGQVANGEGAPGTGGGQPVTGVRLTINSGTGTARLTILEAGLGSP